MADERRLYEAHPPERSADAEAHAPERRSRTKRRTAAGELWEWTKAIVIAVVLSYLVRTFLFAPTIVDGESMMDTLLNHERVIVNKLIYHVEAPKRGEIIVFHATPDKDFIKRVIGVAGDRIEMKNDTLYINGQAVDEPYLNDNKALWKKELAAAHMDGAVPYTEDFIVDRVPDGTVFVLGDNRRNSTDSRVLGPVPVDRVIGRAEFVFWPLERFRWLHP